MFRLSKRTFVSAVVVGFCAPGVLPFTITGPSSAQSNGSVTITWTSVSTDPTTFQIDIDENLDSLQQSDPYLIVNDIETASGSATFNLGALSVGTHRIAFSSTDGFQVLTEGSIEILAAASSSGASSSTTAPVSSPPASSTSPSSSSSSSPSIPATSSSSQSSQTRSTQSQTATSGPQNGATKHHSNAGAIAGGVVGAIVVILLALLGWWYFRRRRGSGAAGQESHGDSHTPQFLAAPVSSALAAPAVHNWSLHDEFRPWEDESTAASAAATRAPTASAPASTVSASVLTRSTFPAPTTSAPASTVSTNQKQPTVMRWDPPAVDGTQPDPGPSRDELLEEVQRLREHINVIAPPSYSE